VTRVHVADPTLALVVPCYNEASRLDAGAFEAALDLYPWLRLLLVNDGSIDATPSVLDTLVQRRPRVARALHLSPNGGKAAAVRAGLLEARGWGDLVGFCDADLSAPLSEVDYLRSVAIAHPGVQWVWGIRLLSMGRRVERRALRHYLGRGFATAASLSLGVQAYDTQCGCKLFRTGPLLDAVLRRPFRSRWIFDVELLARGDRLARAAGEEGAAAFVLEEPLREWRHVGGSKVRPTDFVRAAGELLLIRRDLARHGA
jgi:dolichyl-phosphate beta-glucosyltransferase